MPDFKLLSDSCYKQTLNIKNQSGGANDAIDMDYPGT
jgi:hypothetical protein